MSMPQEIAVAPFFTGQWQFLVLVEFLWLGFFTYRTLLSPMNAPGTLKVIRQQLMDRWTVFNRRSIYLLLLLRSALNLSSCPTVVHSRK